MAALPPWRLVLASASPRRRQLLQGLDLPVEITRVDVDETPPSALPLDQVAEHLALKKANAWSGNLAEDQVLVTADTTVLLEHEDRTLLLNKPEKIILGDYLEEGLSAEEIAYYVERYRPMDKAGAYGVQDWIGYTAVERIEGSFYTVMGLPMHRVHTELKRLALVR